MEENKYTEWVIRYLNNELSVTERNDFEQQLESNATLRKELKLQKIISEEIKAIALEELRDSLSRESLKYRQKKDSALSTTKTYSTWLRWCIIGVGVSLMIIGIYFMEKHYFNQGKPTDNQNIKPIESPDLPSSKPIEKKDSILQAPNSPRVIAEPTNKKKQFPTHNLESQMVVQETIDKYQEIFKQEIVEEASSLKSTDKNNNNLLFRLYSLFLAARYDECIQIAAQVEEKMPNYLTLTRIIAHAALQQKDYSFAIPKFESIVDSKQKGFDEAAKEPLLVAYLGAGRLHDSSCQKLIEELINAADPEHAEILKKLKQISVPK